jgi:ATP-binding protein involved in chromosome partitioning
MDQANSPQKVAPARAPYTDHSPLAGIDRVIAIGSGKGGVGKSTVTVLLAHALRAAGHKVAILDADIYGPSIPRMLGVQGQPELNDQNKMIPLVGHSIPCMSMGFLMAADTAAIWRGPMLSKAIHQLARGTDWKSGQSSVVSRQKKNSAFPDFLTSCLPGFLLPNDRRPTTDDSLLLLDLPPGTGDVHLSMVQQLPVSAAILVTTPQQVATDDARKCATMFQKLNIPILGIVENMAYLEPTPGEKIYPFGQGGGPFLAEGLAVPLLASLPLDPALGAALDKGEAPTESQLKSLENTLTRLSN